MEPPRDPPRSLRTVLAAGAAAARAARTADGARAPAETMRATLLDVPHEIVPLLLEAFGENLGCFALYTRLINVCLTSSTLAKACDSEAMWQLLCQRYRWPPRPLVATLTPPHRIVPAITWRAHYRERCATTVMPIIEEKILERYRWIRRARRVRARARAPLDGRHYASMEQADALLAEITPMFAAVFSARQRMVAGVQRILVNAIRMRDIALVRMMLEAGAYRWGWLRGNDDAYGRHDRRAPLTLRVASRMANVYGWEDYDYNAGFGGLARRRLLAESVQILRLLEEHYQRIDPSYSSHFHTWSLTHNPPGEDDDTDEDDYFDVSDDDSDGEGYSPTSPEYTPGGGEDDEDDDVPREAGDRAADAS
jgi:hypothetical protein